MQTRYPFTLPMGFVTADDRVFRDGEMRLATAGDQIGVLGDPRVRANRAYAVIVLLSRVITRLGDLAGADVTPEIIENLFAADLAYLQRFFREINAIEEPDGAS